MLLLSPLAMSFVHDESTSAHSNATPLNAIIYTVYVYIPIQLRASFHFDEEGCCFDSEQQ
jgi:hypothetical protein